MYTQIHLKRGDTSQTSDFYKDLVEACESGSPATPYAGMLVSYSPYGIACKFEQRIWRLPVEFRGIPVTHVTLLEPEWSAGPLVAGEYKRRRGFAIVTQVAFADRGAPADAWKIEVQASTLGSALHLFNEVVTGKSAPQTAYGGPAKD